jgi:hypothetical protein
VSAFASWLLQNGVTQPNTTPVADHRISPRLDAGHFNLVQSQSVALTVLNLKGATVMNANRFYGPGKHALPTAGLPAGSYVVKLRGADLSVTQRVSVSP